MKWYHVVALIVLAMIVIDAVIIIPDKLPIVRKRGKRK